MRLNLTKFNLRVTSAIMLAISIATISLSILLPVNPTASSQSTMIQSPATPPAASQPATNENLFSDLLDVDLRKPLVDPPHNPSTSALGSADGTLGLRLAGTIIEPTHSYAVFTEANGQSEIKTVGEKAGGADISDITADAVTLRLPGRSIVLHTVKPPAIGGLGS